MTGGQQRRAPARKFARLAERRDVLRAFARHSRAHELRRRRRHQHLAMPRDVVPVRVRHERQRLRTLRVEPKVVPRQMQAALMKDGDHG